MKIELKIKLKNKNDEKNDEKTEKTSRVQLHRSITRRARIMDEEGYPYMSYIATYINLQY